MTQRAGLQLSRVASLALGLLLCSGLWPTVQAEEVAVRLRQVTEDRGRAGLQAQRPLWSSGPIPLLAFELTDRARTTHLTVAGLVEGHLQIQPVPGSSAGRLGKLGAGQQRADSSVSWWPGRRDFVFVRHLDGGYLMYFDGAARPVPSLPEGQVLEASLGSEGQALYLTLALGRETELHRAPIVDGEFGSSTRVLGSEQVIHSLVPARDGHSVVAIGTGRGTTELLTVSTQSGAVTARSSFDGFELLSLARSSDSDSFLAFARRLDRLPSEGTGHVLLEVKHGSPKAKVLAAGIYLPPGLAPVPTTSGSGRFVYLVRSDTELGNPIVRLDRESGLEEVLALETRGHQEVSIGEFLDSSGRSVPWIAVVAVGDQQSDDVANHLFIGPLGPWTNW